jgi:hypothetical protein
LPALVEDFAGYRYARLAGRRTAPNTFFWGQIHGPMLQLRGVLARPGEIHFLGAAFSLFRTRANTLPRATPLESPSSMADRSAARFAAY